MSSSTSRRSDQYTNDSTTPRERPATTADPTDQRTTIGRPNAIRLKSSFRHPQAIDDHSRWLYAEVLPSERAEHCDAFLRRAVTSFAQRGIRVERVLSVNAKTYRGNPWRDTCSELALERRYIRPDRPRTNGKAERAIQTLLNEWAYARLRFKRTTHPSPRQLPPLVQPQTTAQLAGQPATNQPVGFVNSVVGISREFLVLPTLAVQPPRHCIAGDEEARLARSPERSPRILGALHLPNDGEGRSSSAAAETLGRQKPQVLVEGEAAAVFGRLSSPGSSRTRRNNSRSVLTQPSGTRAERRSPA
jgi:hypothetical protein